MLDICVPLQVLQSQSVILYRNNVLSSITLVPSGNVVLQMTGCPSQSPATDAQHLHGLRTAKHSHSNFSSIVFTNVCYVFHKNTFTKVYYCGTRVVYWTLFNNPNPNPETNPKSNTNHNPDLTLTLFFIYFYIFILPIYST